MVIAKINFVIDFSTQIKNFIEEFNIIMAKIIPRIIDY